MQIDYHNDSILDDPAATRSPCATATSARPCGAMAAREQIEAAINAAVQQATAAHRRSWCRRYRTFRQPP